MNGVFSGLVDWAIVAVEIRPGAGGEPINRAPVAQNGLASTRQNTAVSVVLAATDPDGDPLTYRVVTWAAHGSLAGADSFRFVANDGQIDSNIATISITIAPADAPTSTPTPTPTSTPTPTPAPPAQIGGLWISAAELARLPTSGAAWDRMKAAADGDLGTPTLADYNANHDVKTLAVALVYGRTGEARYRQKAADAIRSAIGKEAGGLVIMLARNLVCYIISADLIDLKSYDPALDGQFRQWISAMRTQQFSDGTLISEHERRANNHGIMPGASRAAIAVYLGDTQELARTAQIFKGWGGDRAAYSGFKYPYDLTWQVDPANPVAINPAGGMIQGRAVGGAMPEEMRRGCTFTWPPCQTGYPWEGLQGALVQANILARQGYDVWNWQNRALLRAVQYLQSLEQQYPGWWASGDETWVPCFVNYAYGTNFPTSAANIGKNMGWTDWMYAR